jgi:hypothetical protein
LRRVAHSAPTHAPMRLPHKMFKIERPVSTDLFEWDGARAERECRRDHDQAHGLVEDDGFQSVEAKLADQQRQPELRAPQPNQPPSVPMRAPEPNAAALLRSTGIRSFCIVSEIRPPIEPSARLPRVRAGMILSFGAVSPPHGRRAWSSKWAVKPAHFGCPAHDRLRSSKQDQQRLSRVLPTLRYLSPGGDAARGGGATVAQT